MSRYTLTDSRAPIQHPARSHRDKHSFREGRVDGRGQGVLIVPKEHFDIHLKNNPHLISPIQKLENSGLLKVYNQQVELSVSSRQLFLLKQQGIIKLENNAHTLVIEKDYLKTETPVQKDLKGKDSKKRENGSNRNINQEMATVIRVMAGDKSARMFEYTREVNSKDPQPQKSFNRIVEMDPPFRNDEGIFRDKNVQNRDASRNCTLTENLKYEHIERYPKERKYYELIEQPRGLRLSRKEIEVMYSLGRFGAINTEHLKKYAYRGNSTALEKDLKHLFNQKLNHRIVTFDKQIGRIDTIMLTHRGASALKSLNVIPEGQRIHLGINNHREMAYHDGHLYAIYQKEARNILDNGGKQIRVIVERELKGRIGPELSKIRKIPEPLQEAARQNIADKQHLQVVNNRIMLPDVRLEYETRDGQSDRVDLELVTSNYKAESIAEKAQAGFRIYATPGDAAALGHVIKDRELLQEILTL